MNTKVVSSEIFNTQSTPNSRHLQGHLLRGYSLFYKFWERYFSQDNQSQQLFNPKYVLSAGCGTGEEVWTLIIAYFEYCRLNQLPLSIIPMTIHCIDANQDVLPNIDNGMYSVEFDQSPTFERHLSFGLSMGSFLSIIGRYCDINPQTTAPWDFSPHRNRRLPLKKDFYTEAYKTIRFVCKQEHLSFISPDKMSGIKFDIIIYRYVSYQMREIENVFVKRRLQKIANPENHWFIGTTYFNQMNGVNSLPGATYVIGDVD